MKSEENGHIHLTLGPLKLCYKIGRTAYILILPTEVIIFFAFEAPGSSWR